MKDVLTEIKGKMTPEEILQYDEGKEKAKDLLRNTSNPGIAGSLGGEISMSLLGAEAMGLVTMDDLVPILEAATLAMKGIVMTDKYIPKDVKEQRVPPVDLSSVN